MIKCKRERRSCDSHVTSLPVQMLVVVHLDSIEDLVGGH